MTTIRVTPRDQSATTCPYCHDRVSVGQSCSDCGATYHAECAQTFAVCASLGCKGRFVAPGGQAVLPRVAVLARRLATWRVEGLGPRGPQAVILDPSPRAAREEQAAALAVADLLGPGHTAYDGRLRLQAAYPEPLVRFDTPELAERAVDALRAHGLCARTMPLADLVRPLEVFEPVAAEVHADRVLLRSKGGAEQREVRADERRLLLGAKVVVEVAKASTHAVVKRNHRGHAYTTTKRDLFPTRTTRPESAAFVIRPGERAPTFLRSSTIRVDATQSLRTQVAGWALVTQHLGRGAVVRELSGATATPLMAQVDTGGADAAASRRDNVASLLLLARLAGAAWEAEGAAKA
ncbi:MAG: hypothetical protein AB7N76_35125 [Planctomycetota bacterium]